MHKAPGQLCLGWEWLGVQVKKQSLSPQVKGEDQGVHD